jgi:hypothetical protein
MLDEDVVTDTEDQTLSDAEETSMHAAFANTRHSEHGKAPVPGFVTDLGMEKITGSTDNFSVISMETSKIVSYISATNDTWQTIARESMLYWDTVAREANLHLKGENGLLKKDEIVSEHVTEESPQQVMPTTTCGPCLCSPSFALICLRKYFCTLAVASRSSYP